MSLAPGTRLGPYEIIEALGHGGMGEVYRARDTRLQRQLAIKTLAPDIASDAPFHNAPYRVKLAHAYHLQRAGSAAEAARILDETLAANRKSLLAGADWPMVFMEAAAVQALRGQSAAALDELDRGYMAGWRDARTLAIDPLFASVRSEPRFTQLLSKSEADVAAMRARADYSGLP